MVAFHSVTRSALRVLLISVVVCFPGVITNAQVKSAPDKTLASILRVEETPLDPNLKIEPVTGFPDRTSLVKNRAATYQAFVICVPRSGGEGPCRSRVFVTSIRDDKTFVLTGEPSEAEVMRPVDELKWLDNDRLSYERWMSPHFGHRYVVNVRTRKQTAAFALSDR